MDDIEDIKKRLVEAFKSENNSYGIAGFADFSDIGEESEKKVKQHFKNDIWASMGYKGTTDGKYAIVLYVTLRAAQKYGDGGNFYPHFGNYVNNPDICTTQNDQERLGGLFRIALKHFGYYCPPPEAGGHRHVAPILVHAGIPNRALRDFIRLIDRNLDNNFQEDFQWLKEYIQKQTPPLHKNVGRIYHFDLEGTDDIWATLSKAIREYRQNDEWEDITPFLGDLPPAIKYEHETIREILKDLEKVQSSETGSRESNESLAPPKIRFNQDYHSFEITRKEKPVFAPDIESTGLFKQFGNNPYEARIRRAPTNGMILWKHDEKEFEHKKLSLFYSPPDHAGLHIMVFDTKSGRLILPTEIEQKGLAPLRHLVFANKHIEVGQEDNRVCPWSGWFGAEIDFSDKSHQYISESNHELVFQCGGATIALRQHRREYAVIKYLDADEKELKPSLQRVSFRLPNTESYSGPLFDCITKIAFGGSKTKKIELLRYDHTNDKAGPFKRYGDPVEKSANGLFVLPTKLQDGIYKVRDADRERIHDYFVILDGFRICSENYASDGSIFELKIQRPDVGTLEENPVGEQIVKKSECEQIAHFSISTRYPSLFLDWKWAEPSWGSFTMSWHVKGLRWQVVSKDSNALEEKWSQEMLYVDKMAVNSDTEIQIHFPELEHFEVNDGGKKNPRQTDFGGQWYVPLHYYRDSGKITLRYKQTDHPIALFVEHPLLKSIHCEAGIVTWDGEVPHDSVLMVWEPQRPGSTFKEFLLEDSHIQSKSFEIGAEYVNRPLCYTVVSRYGGLKGCLMALDQSKYPRQKVAKVVLINSSDKNDIYLTTFFEQLFNSRYEGENLPDVERWLLNQYKGCPQDNRQSFLGDIETFILVMMEFLEKPLVRKSIAPAWTVSVPNIPQWYDEWTKNQQELAKKISLGWAKPKQIDLDYTDDTDSHYPNEYFRDLWLISTLYQESDLSYISRDEYVRHQRQALDRLIKSHEEYGFPDIKKLAPISFIHVSEYLWIPGMSFDGFGEVDWLENKPTTIPQILGLENVGYLFYIKIRPKINYKKYDYWFDWYYDKDSCHIIETERNNQIPITCEPIFPMYVKASLSAYLETMSFTSPWKENIYNPFRSALYDLSDEFSPCIITELFKEEQDDFISAIVPGTHLIRSFFDYVGTSKRYRKISINNRVGNPSAEEIIPFPFDDTTRFFWNHALLKRLFVNDEDVACAKLNDGGRALEEYLRKTDEILIERLPPEYFCRIQMLAELAVRIGWLGGIGVIAKIDYDTH